MNKRKIVIIIIAVSLIFTSPFSFIKISKIVNDIIITSKVDYIEILSTGEKLNIKKIETIKPTIWKGSNDGVLHYKDGSVVGIDISYYGDFYGIKGEDKRLFSKGVLYHYIIKN